MKASAVIGKLPSEHLAAVPVDDSDQIHEATKHRTLEIGTTWYGTAWQRTGVNTQCKYLLLRHAFEDLSARRVSLKTDHRNRRSQQAILRLGAVQEGTLRNHRIAREGADRHTVYFSVIDSEWPAVKKRLEGLMRR